MLNKKLNQKKWVDYCANLDMVAGIQMAHPKLRRVKTFPAMKKILFETFPCC